LEHFSLLACHTDYGSDEDEVLVHGDYCLPNVLFDADGCHYLDVGEADRYIDIVAGIWRLRYNYGKRSVGKLLDGYGLQTLDLGS
jgi:kanamycin kinase